MEIKGFWRAALKGEAIWKNIEILMVGELEVGLHANDYFYCGFCSRRYKTENWFRGHQVIKHQEKFFRR